MNNYDTRFVKSQTISGIGAFRGGIIITDRQTGVQYLFVRDGYGGGLCPLLDRDGKPLLAEDEKARL